MRVNAPLIIFLLLSLTLHTIVMAQLQICPGSLGNPVVSETFGHGTEYEPGPALPNGVTNLYYFDADCGGPDGGVPGHDGAGLYTIQSTMGSGCKGGSWQVVGQDHTGDTHGYMMVINAGFKPDVFFTEKVDGSKLCAGETYYFNAWVMNLIVDRDPFKDYLDPNLTFTIKAADGTVLNSVSTGNVPKYGSPTWLQYGVYFTAPSDGSDVVLEIRNNVLNDNGAWGNDLMLDDLTFSPCGPLIQAGFNTADNPVKKIGQCAGDINQYTLVGDQKGYPDPVYQWQVNNDDGKGWVDITGANSYQLPQSIRSDASGTVQYRLGVLSSAQARSESCRIFSDPLTVTIAPKPTVDWPDTTYFCEHLVMRFTAGAADSYVYTGPNNFRVTATKADDDLKTQPIVDNDATPADDGIYSVAVTVNGCTTVKSTYGKVIAGPSVDHTGTPVQLCLGQSVQLDLHAQNTDQYLWTPAAGLDNPKIANPKATPTITTTYYLAATSAGCATKQANGSVTVTVNQPPVAIVAESKITITEGQTAKLAGTASGDNIVYYWTPADYLNDPHSLTPVTSSPNDITYTLHVVSNANCGESDQSVFVRVYKKVTVPNTFTPNNDGVNDHWNITNMDSYPEALITVYDRNGQPVFQSRGYAKPWDGKRTGQPVPPGAYYYVINYNDDYLKSDSGWVMIVR